RSSTCSSRARWPALSLLVSFSTPSDVPKTPPEAVNTWGLGERDRRPVSMYGPNRHGGVRASAMCESSISEGVGPLDILFKPYSRNVLNIAVTVVPPRGSNGGRDVVVRAGAHRRVAELANELARSLGLTSQVGHGLIVERTGEHLVPHRRVDEV